MTRWQFLVDMCRTCRLRIKFISRHVWQRVNGVPTGGSTRLWISMIPRCTTASCTLRPISTLSAQRTLTPMCHSRVVLSSRWNSQLTERSTTLVTLCAWIVPFRTCLERAGQWMQDRAQAKSRTLAP